MALKTLKLRKNLDDTKKQLEELRGLSVDFEKREAEIEKAINEAETDDDKKVVEEEIEKFDAEKTEHNEKVAELEKRVEEIENDLRSCEEKQETKTVEQKEERKEAKTMVVRKNMTFEERSAFFTREDVKGFLDRLREAGQGNRAITGKELLIPTVMLDLIRENIEQYSKLYNKVHTVYVAGKGRQPIMGTIPEGVWTEMCATLNELALTFNEAEVDGYKVGGFIPVCNAVLEDNDVALGSEIIKALGQAIGIALDKAILYGTGTKMPLGIVTRLAQTSEPATYPVNARTWVDLHTSNIKSIASTVTGVDLFKQIILASGNAKGNYSRGAKFWAMNEATYTALVAESLNINAAGAIVSGQNGTMPVVGGDIVVLNFIPANVIIGGYGDLYLLAEREGTSIQQSEHAQFIQDNTVFKGTARYDGLPVIAEGFVAIGINGTTPNATMTFATDSANAGE